LPRRQTGSSPSTTSTLRFQMLGRARAVLLQWPLDRSLRIANPGIDRSHNSRVLRTDVLRSSHHPTTPRKTIGAMAWTSGTAMSTNRGRSTGTTAKRDAAGGTDDDGESPPRRRHAGVVQSKQIVLIQAFCKSEEHDVRRQVVHRRSTIPTNIRGEPRCTEVHFLAHRHCSDGCARVPGELMSDHLSSVVFDA
jgi:hypothetical protein